MLCTWLSLNLLPIPLTLGIVIIYLNFIPIITIYILRGHPKRSTFSRVYTQYTFSDPLPPPPKVYRPTFWGSKTRISRNTFIVQQQKLSHLWSLLCDKWYIWLCIMICRLQLILYISKLNLNIYLFCVQRQYGQFHNIKCKMPKSRLLIGLETSFKNWQKAQHVNIYFISKAYICCYHLLYIYGLYTCENVDNYGWPLIILAPFDSMSVLCF